MMKLVSLASFLSMAGAFRVGKGRKGRKGGRKGKGASKQGALRADACGMKGAPGNASMSIVRGDDADECEWRWQVGLHKSADNLRSPFCGGMLITPEWVLTAAHCMVYRSFAVVAGDWKTNAASGNEQVRMAAKSIKHPDYDDLLVTNNDFALVKLDRPMELNGCVGTVCLPEQGADVAPGSACWISGWGTLETGGSSPTTLQEVELEVLSNEDCQTKTGYYSWQITPESLCAQGFNKGGVADACQGDSGGPLVCEADGKWTIYGATSWGNGCASKRYPGVWARVHEALGWIDETMSKN